MRVKYVFSAKKTGKYRKSPMTNKHRIAFPKLVRDVIMTSDIILEVLDARFIDKTRNIEMENFIKEQGKKIIYVINKVDLVNMAELKTNYDFSKLMPYVFFSSKSNIGRARLRLLIKIEMKKMKTSNMDDSVSSSPRIIKESEGLSKTAFINNRIAHKEGRVGVIGYPNTGKSTLINILSGKKGTATSPEAGFTKAQQKIRFSKGIVILDTPGVFQEKERPDIDVGALKKHAILGVKNFDRIKEPDIVVANLMNENKGLLESFYGIEANGDVEILLEGLGRRKRFLKKGNVVDIIRTAKEILRDWQHGKIMKK